MVTLIDRGKQGLASMDPRRRAFFMRQRVLAEDTKQRAVISRYAF